MLASTTCVSPAKITEAPYLATIDVFPHIETLSNQHGILQKEGSRSLFPLESSPTLLPQIPARQVLRFPTHAHPLHIFPNSNFPPSSLPHYLHNTIIRMLFGLRGCQPKHVCFLEFCREPIRRVIAVTSVVPRCHNVFFTQVRCMLRRWDIC